FGTAPFWRRLGAGQARALLHAATDEGLTHIDTAPMYGFGYAERLVGGFLAERRDEVTVATKVGLHPPGAAASRALPGRLLRGPLGVREDFGLSAVRRSFERSLRDLQTNHVDFLLLHECAPEHLNDDLLGFLEECVLKGTARAAGTATGTEATERIGQRWSPFPTAAQVPWEPGAPASAEDGRTVIVHSAVRLVLERVWGPLRERRVQMKRWSDAIGADCSRSDVMAALAVALARRENPGSCVLFSTRNIERLQANVCLAAGFATDHARLDRFAVLVRETLAEAAVRDRA
ncbi:MAG: aldo/keto reductase, partial [Thermoleophilaceae bacterium]|nr:aldo/keto reductase [Thermoleophilaceae bacterium]